MKALSIILVFLSIIILVLGFSASTGAPQEAVIAGVCCFIGILARMAQAEAHNNKKE